MIITPHNLDQLAFGKDNNSAGLLPCIVQHALTGAVLMQGYMDKAAAEQSLTSGLVTFFSRSKQRLWTKGESSGNHLKLQSLHTDCDADSILALALPNGPTCHLGTPSCFSADDGSDLPVLAQLESVIAARKQTPSDGSYTASLFAAGIKRAAQKVGEEGVEVALAAATKDKDELLNESADLLYHLIVVLQASDLSLTDALAVLASRRK